MNLKTNDINLRSSVLEMSEDPIKYGNNYSLLGGQNVVNEAAVAYETPRYQRIEIIRNGLPFTALELFQQNTGLSRQELGSLLQVSPRTLQRYTSGQSLAPVISEKLLALNDLYQQAAQALGGNAQNTTGWLRAQNKALGGLKPISLLDTYQGLHEVQNLLGRLEWGVYS